MQVKRAKVLKSTSSRDDDEWPVALQTWLSLLRHLVYHSASAKSVVAQTQLLPALQQSWNVVSSSGTTLHEGLLLISTLVSDSFDGRHLFATTGQSPLLVTMVRAFLRYVSTSLFWAPGQCSRGKSEKLAQSSLLTQSSAVCAGTAQECQTTLQLASCCAILQVLWTAH